MNDTPPMAHKIIRPAPYIKAEDTNIRARFESLQHGANSNKPVLDADPVPVSETQRK
ncbi:hypothetical protein [Herminiimonas sp. CN]|uniref:hypothetical protein n=1 Tax=Herminiimonas sp. CN TaxID=1349818 RepID=UPI0012DE43F6|nr:hypothetical protein [Herminiimonas sp. CN]